MQIVRDAESLAAALKDVRKGGRLALVPTMGALHDGHLALVAAARRHADRVAATIFVNPLQFNDPRDLERYPRTLDADLAKLKAACCDLVWLPEAADLYPDGMVATVRAGAVGRRWEGEHRPGHFDGVATVVARLFKAVRPDVALFGEKDFQQLAVIRRMVADLKLPLAIVGHETVREADGLAMSSRNALLGSDERRRAATLYEAIQAAAAEISCLKPVAGALAASRERIGKAGFGPIDYLAYVDGQTLEPLEEWREGGRIIAAAWLGDVRLIDNERV